MRKSRPALQSHGRRAQNGHGLRLHANSVGPDSHRLSRGARRHPAARADPHRVQGRRREPRRARRARPPDQGGG